MLSNSVPFLTSERLELHKLTKEHCNREYLSWLHNKDVNHYLETGVYPQTVEDLVSFIEAVQLSSGLFLAIHIKSNGKHIGNIKIDSIKRIHGLAEYGILIGSEEEWGKGYAKEASLAVLHHCFNKMNLRKITLGVLKENEAAVSLYKKMGFSEEGRLLRHVFFQGDYVDVLRMAIFKEDWHEK